MSAVKHIGASGDCESYSVLLVGTVMYYTTLVR